MGRAKGAHHQVAADRFATVLGAQRGVPGAKALLAGETSSHARAELGRLIAELPDTPDGALAALAAAAATGTQSTALDELRAEVSRFAVEQAMAEHGNSRPLRAALAAASVRGRFSDHLVVDSKLSPALRRIHVCALPAWRRETNQNLGMLCGEIMVALRTMWEASNRGDAAADSARVCTACSSLARRTFPEGAAELDEVTPAPVLSAVDVPGITAAARARVSSQLPARGAGPLSDGASAALADAVLDSQAARMHSRFQLDPFMAMRAVLDVPGFQAVDKVLGARRSTPEMAQLLSESDWRELLRPVLAPAFTPANPAAAVDFGALVRDTLLARCAAR